MGAGENENIFGKLALVTGASRGIGKAIAKALHEAGARVVITGRYPETLQKAAKEIGERCHAIACDQSDPLAIKTMSTEVIHQYGTPDILVNNAGTWTTSPVVDMPLEVWNTIIAINLTGVFLTSKAFLPGMLEKNRGDIIMISSTSGKQGDPGASAYAASKFGLQGFSQSLMYEVRRHNIRVIVLNPSQVDKSEESEPKSGPGLALHANDIAATVVHLISLPRRTMVRDLDIYGTNPF